MTLVSFSFICFLLIMLLLYYLLPSKWQWVILLFGSIAFYMLAGTPYTFVYVIISVLSIYFGTHMMDKKPERKKSIYVLTLLINILMLVALKYTNFILVNVSLVGSWFSDNIHEGDLSVKWIASLGISFYALQMIGYLTDCYWGIAKSQKNIGKLALYNIYFPQMISGPINKYSNLSESLYAEHKFDATNLREGGFRVLQGFFKKLVVSEQLTVIVNYLYANYTEYDGIYVWIGTALYLLQLYSDFSGCMDIVLGASKCFGIDMAENFKAPFCSTSVQEFWQRFHISLGAWLKDYIMYPLMRSGAFSRMTKKLKNKYGKKVAKMIPTFAAMFVVWFCMGLWHGGGWNFIGEGIWFWLMIVLSQLLEKPLKSLGMTLHINGESKCVHGLKCVGTGFLIGIGILFFKAESLGAAFKMIGSAFNPARLMASARTIKDSLVLLDSVAGTNRIIWAVTSAVVGLIVMILFGLKDKTDERFHVYISKKNFYIRLLIGYLLVMAIIFLGAYGPGYSASEFIYGGF